MFCVYCVLEVGHNYQQQEEEEEDLGEDTHNTCIAVFLCVEKYLSMGETPYFQV